MEDCEKNIGIQNEFRSVLDALPGLVWTALPDGHVDFLNQRWCEYTGLSDGESYGWGWQTAIHPEDLPELLECWRAILASGELREMEARLRRFDGEYRWFQFRISALTDPSGKIVKWCGMNTDVDERRGAEETLSATERRFRLIVDGLPTLVTLRTPAGDLEYANRQVLEYVGATLDELKALVTTGNIHPDDCTDLIAAWTQALETGHTYDIEARRLRADGVYRWFHMRGSPLRDADGRIVIWYLLATDIDDQKRAEALLRGEKRLLEMVARGHSMSKILDALCHFVENIVSGCYCSVVLVDPSGTCLEHGAAPSLPSSFVTSISGRPVSVETGPSAMAMCLNEQVISADLTRETRWMKYEWCPMALANGLQACWSTPISSTAGKVLGAFAIYYPEPKTPTPQDQSLIHQFTDIASIAIERAQSNTALKQSEARKAAILDSALDSIVTIDHEGCIVEFNPAAEKTFGYRRSEVVGEHLADIIIPPSLRERHRQGLARYLATGEAQLIGKRMEMTAVRADGEEFPVELAITRIPLDGPPSFTGYLRDITERKHAEEELQRSEAFLAEAQRLSSTGSFSWRAATDEFTLSEQFYRIFELDPAAPVTVEQVFSRVHPEDASLLYELLDRARRDGSDFEYEHRLQMPDHSIKYVNMVAHGTRDSYGQLEYIGAVQDVTERRLSEDALSKARSELAHVSRLTTLGVLTASIAHEVNQPLSGIITNASTCLRMLAANPPNVEGAIETARRTIRDGNRASDVIKRLRALFGKKEATTELVDLNEVTREVIALSLGKLQRNGVVVRPEFGDALPSVTGDRVQLQQVILNLIVNASDAMSDVDDRPRQVVIRTERDETDSVRLSVRDSGVGFDPHGVDKLFEAFYTTKNDGMGIGLSVSRSIIQGHNGRLWATPNDGPGVTFSFSIPREYEHMPPSHNSNDFETAAFADAVHVMRNS